MKNISFSDFLEVFSTQEDVVKAFIKVRYGKAKPICNHCQSDERIYKRGIGRFYDCKKCGNSFSIFKDTAFEHTATDLRKWMYVMHLFLNDRGDMSGMQLQKEIQVTYKTAWRMLKIIRETIKDKQNERFIDIISKIDKSYMNNKFDNSPNAANDNNKKNFLENHES